MHHLIYGSRATKPFSDSELLALLLQARSNNLRYDITGALVYGAGQFMQIMEGEEAVVVELYERIQQDPRHDQLVRYADKPIRERSFGEWSMAFQPVSEAQFKDLMGYLPASTFQDEVPDLGSADVLLLQMMKTLVTTPLG